MIDYEHFDLFQQDSVDKQLTIQYDNTTITNEDIFEQTMTLDEALCSQKELRFGSCEASVIKFKIANIFLPMYGKEITTKIVPEKHNAEPLQIGKYKVETDTPTADRQWREITAYDAMHDIVNADVAEWYNTILPNDDSIVTLKEFRQSFIKHFELEEVIPKDGLANDNMTVRKTIGVVASSETSGSGSTLIACEQLNRICYTMELEPKYVDVIIERWEKLTGGKVVLLNGETEERDKSETI